MKLRVRLFLWVGGIFFVSYWISLFFENQMTDTNLTKASNDLRAQIIAGNEEQRKHLEEYLKVALSEDQARIDALLLRLSNNPSFASSLFLDAKPIDLMAPAHTAFIFKNNTKLEFIQTTKNGKLTSLFAPIEFPMDEGYRMAVPNEPFSFFFLSKNEKNLAPFIGIPLTYVKTVSPQFSLLLDEIVNIGTGFEVLFEIEQLPFLNEHLEKMGAFTSSITLEKSHNQIDLPAFLLRIKKAAEYVEAQKETLARKEKEMEVPADQIELPFAHREMICLDKIKGARIDEKIVQIAEREDQAMMFMALTGLYPSGLFGESPFSSLSPRGIAKFPIEGEEIDQVSGKINPKAGTALLTDRAFFNHALFDDATYFKEHPSFPTCTNVGSSIALISFPAREGKEERLFLGNTTHLTSPKEPNDQGYVTVAVDVNNILEDLVLSLHQNGFLIHQGRIISGLSENGDRISDPQILSSFSTYFSTQTQGSFVHNGVKYYYIRMTPFSELDLHFVILEKEKIAFSVLDALDVKSRKLIADIASRMRLIAGVVLIIVLLLLHNVAKRITKPISLLAKATEHVAAGRFEKIDLPQFLTPSRHDEMAILYSSFRKMIKGLKEKEKVKGVLNKVVSPEIAEEILKGTVHLGGEERKVTILFADIRGFTQLSAHIPAQEVVDILNTCMTKISHVIDSQGGVIDKYVGDEVMALFGAPLEKTESALSAIKAGLELTESLEKWNQERKRKGLEPIYMGVGIHTGMVVAGNMGAENRLNYTVLGKNVNFAARLCSAAGKMEILISKETLEEPHVKEQIIVEEAAPIELKGFEGLFTLYRVKGKKHG